MLVNLLPKFECPRVEFGGIRRYSTPHGQFPSVTTIIGSTADKTGLEFWRRKVGAAEADRIRDEGAARGTKLHDELEKYMLKGVESSGPWWDSMAPVLKDIDDVRLIEAPLWNEQLGYAGTVDLVARYRGEMAVIDWKTARKRKERKWIGDYALQGTAYAGAANIRYAGKLDKITKVVIAVALEDAPAQVFVFNRKQLIAKWAELKKRLHAYHNAGDAFFEEIFGV